VRRASSLAGFGGHWSGKDETLGPRQDCWGSSSSEESLVPGRIAGAVVAVRRASSLAGLLGQ